MSLRYAAHVRAGYLFQVSILLITFNSAGYLAMIVSRHKPTLHFYSSYIQGAEEDSISPLAWVLSQEHNLHCDGVETVLRRLNPLVCVQNEDDPEAVSICSDDEQEIVLQCTLAGVLVG